MITEVDIIKEHKFSWMIMSINIDKTKSTINYILKAIKDKSDNRYGIILCNSLINITEFRDTFKHSKYDFIKLCYNTIVCNIKLNFEKLVWSIKHSFKSDNNANIIFE